MREWLTTLEVAKRLNVSKEVVKYHRKKLDADKVKELDGVFYISEQGVKDISSRLTKMAYANSFEGQVLERLSSIEAEIKIMRKYHIRDCETSLEGYLADLNETELKWAQSIVEHRLRYYSERE